MRNRLNTRMVLPIQIGVVALVAAGLLIYLTVKGPADTKPSPDRTRGEVVATKPLVSKAGGFRMRIPDGMTATRLGKTVKLSSQDGVLVVTAGPIGGKTLASAGNAFVASLKSTYSHVRVLGHQKQRVDGRAAVATFGQAVNAKKVTIRFVNVAVAAKPRNFAINTFTGLDSDPQRVLPLVNAMLNSFHVG